MPSPHACHRSWRVGKGKSYTLLTAGGGSKRPGRRWRCREEVDQFREEEEEGRGGKKKDRVGCGPSRHVYMRRVLLPTLIYLHGQDAPHTLLHVWPVHGPSPLANGVGVSGGRRLRLPHQ
jgi:hypothetical protein